MEAAAIACSKEPAGMSPNADDHDSGLELGLGLSLGTGAASTGVKFLTAQDLPSVAPHSGLASSLRRPQPQPRHPAFQAAISGTKRAAEPDASASSPPALSQVVGWPPIRTYRINNLASQNRAPNTEDGKNKKMNSGNDSKAKQENAHHGFVKVNMDGVQIGRKVDLNAHSCYESLAQSIQDMFFKPSISSASGEKVQQGKASKLLDGSSEFVLTYEDKEGDWMLVGDVPFRMFIGTVKRFRIMRTSEANGLAPRLQERNDGPRGRPI